MHTGEDAHWHLAGVVANKHFIDFQDRTELSIQCLSRDVRQVKIDLVLTSHPLTFNADLEYFARGDVAGNEIAVGGKLFLEEVPSFFFWYR